MFHFKSLFSLLISLFLFQGCNQKQELRLKHVTTADFIKFTEATKYITDAEKFGWSLVQSDIKKFTVVDGATWKLPDGVNEAKLNFPVTQVSYNDAIAYCKWATVDLPTYEDYWEHIKLDTKKVNIHSTSIKETTKVNFLGNTWDITSSTNEKQEIRLAGGSYLCSKQTCDGTNPKRVLFVSPDTGNSHISFVILTN